MTDPRNLRFGPISAAAPGSLYEQLVAAVKREVSAGRLSSGDPLPSLRVLAADLLISLITVKRAYEELEREGVIYSRQGLGAFVAEGGAQAVRSDRADAARAAIALAVAAGAEAGLGEAQLHQMLQQEIDRGTKT